MSLMKVPVIILTCPTCEDDGKEATEFEIGFNREQMMLAIRCTRCGETMTLVDELNAPPRGFASDRGDA